MQCWKVDIGRSCKGISDQRTGIRYNRLAQRRNGEKEASMNKVILVGRLTRDPEVRYADKEKKRVFTRYTLAVERKIKKEQEPTADFICCKLFPAGDADRSFRADPDRELCEPGGDPDLYDGCDH